MRNAQVQILKNKEEKVCGIVLEGDYCSEHEQGIKPLLQTCGIKPLEFQSEKHPNGYPKDYTGPWGMERITIHSPQWRIPSMESPKGNLVIKDAKETKNREAGCLLIGEAYHGYDPRELPPLHELGRKINFYRGNPIEFSKSEITRLAEHAKKHDRPNYDKHTSSAWTDDGFAILSRDPEVIVFLHLLYEGLQGKMPLAAIWTGGAGNNPFARNGLVLGIPPLIDPENLKTMEEAEKGQAEVHWMAQATGVYEAVPKSLYFALGPGRVLKTRNGRGENKGPEEVPPTKHPLMFFLNPMDQKNNEFGWFTVEELTAWAKGEPNPIAKPKP